MTLVRGVRRGPLPVVAAFRHGGGLGRGDRGRAQEAPPAVGHDAGRLESRGWRRALTLRSQIHPRPPPPPHLPPGPPPRWHASSGAGKGPGSGARDMRDRLGHARTHGPRKSRPWPHGKRQAIALQPATVQMPQMSRLVVLSPIADTYALPSRHMAYDKRQGNRDASHGSR
jgi:hypothetical protein